VSDLEQFLTEHERISLFLDFDGVLVELAETPDAIEVPGRLPGQLERLKAVLDGAVAIVSGRGLAEIDRMIGPVRMPIAGDHGNQRRRPDGDMVWLNPAAQSAAAKLADRLRSRVSEDDRLLVELKSSAVALHYRRAPEREQFARNALQDAVADDPVWSTVTGKMVIEARAKGANKGEAVQSYMGEVPFQGRVPVFIGDDVTDEDGFRAVQDLGGAGIKVGPGNTCARFRIAGPSDVPALLDRLAREPRGDIA